jgi:hypothetical protein
MPAIDAAVLALIAEIRAGDQQSAQGEYERALADVTLYSACARSASQSDLRRLYAYAHVGATARLHAAKPTQVVAKKLGMVKKPAPHPSARRR